MKDTDVIQLLQHYRHDLMNHFQVVQGYISMNKIEKAKEKLNETTALYHEERKLMHAFPSEFILWVMQVNIVFNHINLEYRILTEKKMQHVDHELTLRCKKIISAVNKTYGTEEPYEINMQIMDMENAPFVEVSFLIKGENSQEELLRSNLDNDNIKVGQSSSGLVCSFLIQ